MSEHSIPVDLFNPGQVFACLGFLEAAEILLGDAEGRFDWSSPSGETRFHITGPFEANPFQETIDFLIKADYTSISPFSSFLERDKGTTDIRPETFPCAFFDAKGKARNALLPISARRDQQELIFNAWCDLDSGRPCFQLWTATNGNSAWIRFSKILNAAKEAVRNHQAYKNPFNSPAEVAANFRLELRRNWTAIGLGFSPDRINKASGTVPVQVSTYPLVEMIAVYGLSHSRPSPTDDKARWTYACWNQWLSPVLARLALQGSSPLSTRTFQLVLEAPNDGGDLSIAYAEEREPFEESN